MLRPMRCRLFTVLPLAVLVGCADEAPSVQFDNLSPSAGGQVTATGGNAGAPLLGSPPIGGAGGALAAGGAAGISSQQGGAPPFASGGGVPPIGAAGAGGIAGSTGGGVPPSPTTTATGPAPYEPPPGSLSDIQFMMQSDVPPGGETLMCMFAAMPSDRGVIAVQIGRA